MSLYSNILKRINSRLRHVPLSFANLCHNHNNCHSFARHLHSCREFRLSKFSMLRTCLLTYTKSMAYYSTLKQSIISDLSQNIDVERIKETCERAAAKTGKQMCAKAIVMEELNNQFDQAIENFSEKQKRALKIIRLEHSFLFFEEYIIPAPEEMTSQNWLEALSLNTMEERLSYYLLLEENRQKGMEADSHREDETLVNDVDNPCSIFYDVENPELPKRWGNYRLASAMQFGIPLVIDMGYDDINMSFELDDIARQLWNMYCVNRSQSQPFHLIFTNCSPLNPIYRHLLLHYMIDSSVILATFTEKNHVDLFPRHEMVYLSASSRDVCSMFNNNTIYILGAYHDPLVRKKLSFARARQQNIKCSRLPIVENVRWAYGTSKDLNMDQILGVLLSVKETRSWKEAFCSTVPMLVNQNP